MAALTLRIGPVLQATDREKTDLVLDFLRLPATVLVPFLGAAAERSPQLKDFLARLTDEGNPLAAEEEPGPDSLLARGCVKRLRWGRKAAALRVLLSPGVANEHPRAEAIMRDMHPAPSRPIVAPRDLGPGLAATPADVQDALLCLFRCDFTSMDFSGWNMDLLRPVRGRPDIMGPLSDLVRALANCELPLPVYWLVTTGALVALHKLDDDMQAVRASAGLDPKLRPVNKSALLWKWATQVAISHPEYARACKRMRPAATGSTCCADAASSAPAPAAASVCAPAAPVPW